MIKELTGVERREKLISLMTSSEKPLSGTELGKLTGVSRQVIVQDITLLKAEGHEIVSTPKGYILPQSGMKSRLVKVYHTNEQVEEELTLIVDLGGSVEDVRVRHRAYNEIVSPLKIRNRRDIKRFLEEIETGKSVPLLNITSGYHYHTITAESEEILDEIELALKEKSFLAEFLPYEKTGTDL